MSKCKGERLTRVCVCVYFSKLGYKDVLWMSNDLEIKIHKSHVKRNVYWFMLIVPLCVYMCMCLYVKRCVLKKMGKKGKIHWRINCFVNIVASEESTIFPESVRSINDKTNITREKHCIFLNFLISSSCVCVLVSVPPLLR